MNQHLILILWFGLGVALQVLLLIRGDWNWRRLSLCVAFGVLGMFPGRNEHHYQPFLHVLIALGFFAFMFATRFKDDLLPVISEKVLLSYTLIFWFAFFSYFYNGTAWNNALAVLLLFPSAVTVAIAFKRPKLSIEWKLCLYIWFLCIVVSLGLFQFPFRHMTIFLSPEKSPWLSPMDCIVAGMAFLYLALNIAYLYELIPIPEKNQSWAKRMKEWHELTGLMTDRFEDEPIHRLGMLLVASQGVMLLAIYLFHWVSSALAINILVVLPSILALGGNSTHLALQRKKTAMEAIDVGHAQGKRAQSRA